MMRMTKIQTSNWTWTVGSLTAKKNKRDQRNASHAVGFKAIGAGANRIPRIISGAIGNDAGIARVVFLDFEDDLHQVGADIGDFRENAAGDAEHRRAKRFTDGEADEARACVVTRNK